MADAIAHMPRPCDATDRSGACPFRVDAEPGEFSAARFEKLADTAGSADSVAPLGAPMFACHHTRDLPDGQPAPVACAGWLAVCGRDHIGVRLAVVQGRLPGEVLDRPDGVELFDTYDDMATQQADGVYDPQRADEWRQRAGHGRYVQQAEPEFCAGTARTPGARFR